MRCWLSTAEAHTKYCNSFALTCRPWPWYFQNRWAKAEDPAEGTRPGNESTTTTHSESLLSWTRQRRLTSSPGKWLVERQLSGLNKLMRWDSRLRFGQEVQLSQSASGQIPSPPGGMLRIDSFIIERDSWSVGLQRIDFNPNGVFRIKDVVPPTEDEQEQAQAIRQFFVKRGI
jgi:hypothetical protein